MCLVAARPSAAMPEVRTAAERVRGEPKCMIGDSKRPNIYPRPSGRPSGKGRSFVFGVLACIIRGVFGSLDGQRRPVNWRVLAERASRAGMPVFSHRKPLRGPQPRRPHDSHR
jgi:hypothetical protein